MLWKSRIFYFFFLLCVPHRLGAADVQWAIYDDPSSLCSEPTSSIGQSVVRSRAACLVKCTRTVSCHSITFDDVTNLCILRADNCQDTSYDINAKTKVRTQSCIFYAYMYCICSYTVYILHACAFKWLLTCRFKITTLRVAANRAALAEVASSAVIRSDVCVSTDSREINAR